MTQRLDTVFLDRDGTINVKAPEGQYIRSPEELNLLPGAARAIRRLNVAGVRAVIVTNQRGVARNCMSEKDLEEVHGELRRLLDKEGAAVDDLLACMHDHDSCDCRKPLPGLIMQAVRRNPAISLRSAAMIGDAQSDIELGHRLGLITVRLQASGAPASDADYTASDLLQAVDWLLWPGG